MNIVYKFKNKFKNIFNYYVDYLSYKNNYLSLLKKNKLLKKKNRKLNKKIKNLSNNQQIKTSIFSEEFNIDESYYPIQAF